MKKLQEAFRIEGTPENIRSLENKLKSIQSQEVLNLAPLQSFKDLLVIHSLKKKKGQTDWKIYAMDPVLEDIVQASSGMTEVMSHVFKNQLKQVRKLLRTLQTTGKTQKIFVQLHEDSSRTMEIRIHANEGRIYFTYDHIADDLRRIQPILQRNGIGMQCITARSARTLDVTLWGSHDRIDWGRRKIEEYIENLFSPFFTLENIEDETLEISGQIGRIGTGD